MPKKIKRGPDVPGLGKDYRKPVKKKIGAYDRPSKRKIRHGARQRSRVK